MMTMRPMIAVIWFFAIVHGILFICATPLWEGFDEPFHYAYIQHMAEFGRVPVHGETLVSKEVTASFRALPLSPAVNANLGNRYTDFAAYFELPEPVRKEREQALRNIPHADRRVPDQSEEAVLSYEAQHPPLYYLLAAQVYRVFRDYDFPALIFALRAFSLLIGSAAVFLAYKTAKLFYSDPRRILCFPLLIALLPMFFSTVARISNDSLGVALFSFLVFLVLKYIALGYPRSYAIYTGIVIGLGLLTKAYFLTALPAVAVIYLAAGWKSRSFGPSVRRLSWTFLFAFLVAGAWYIRNYSLYGTVSGLFVMAAAEPAPLLVQLKKILEISWLSGIHVIFKEQLWIGNSSFISISKTYYQLGYLLFSMAAFGLAGFYFPGIFKSIPVLGRVFLREEAEVTRAAPFAADKFAYGTPIAFCFFFVSGMMYQIHQTYIITGHIITGGWYLYAIVIPQLLLLSFGIEVLFGSRWQKPVPPLLITGAFILNFLGYFCKAIPYYTGFKIPHFNLKHLFEVYSPDGFRQVTEQLSLNKPEFATPLAIGIVISAYFVIMLITLALWSRTQNTMRD